MNKVFFVFFVGCVSTITSFAASCPEWKNIDTFRKHEVGEALETGLPVTFSDGTSWFPSVVSSDKNKEEESEEKEAISEFLKKKPIDIAMLIEFSFDRMPESSFLDKCFYVFKRKLNTDVIQDRLKGMLSDFSDEGGTSNLLGDLGTSFGQEKEFLEEFLEKFLAEPLEEGHFLSEERKKILSKAEEILKANVKKFIEKVLRSKVSSIISSNDEFNEDNWTSLVKFFVGVKFIGEEDHKVDLYKVKEKIKWFVGEATKSILGEALTKKNINLLELFLSSVKIIGEEEKYKEVLEKVKEVLNDRY